MMMARFALAALAVALLAVPSAHAVTFYSKETKTSPLVGFTGPLTTVMNDVSGTVTILDDHTFEIKDFHYNGTAPQTHFWAAKSTMKADLLSGYVLNPDRLDRAYYGEDLVVPILSNITWSDVGVIVVWCVEFKVNFGYVVLPTNMGMAPSMMMMMPMAPSGLMTGLPATGGRKLL